MVNGLQQRIIKKVKGGGLSYRCRWDLTILGFELLGLRLGDEFPPLLDSLGDYFIVVFWIFTFISSLLTTYENISLRIVKNSIMLRGFVNGLA